MDKKNKVYLLDGHALAYRAYYAFIRAPLTNSSGKNTSAAYGFALTLLKLLEEQKPEYIAVAFDTPGPTFRHELYSEYKATRQKMPDDLRYQIPWIKEMLRALNISQYENQDFEADDIIGTLAKKAEEEGFIVYLVTGDKDFMQLVGKNIYFYDISSKSKEISEYILGTSGIKKKIGVKPEQVVDLLALEGDSSDNIPGIPKVGRKTAVKLLEEYGTMDNILANSEKIPGKLGEYIRNYKEQAILSRDLAKIHTDVPIDIKTEDIKYKRPDVKILSELFKELEFHSLIEKFEGSESQTDRKYNAEVQKYIIIKNEKNLLELIEELKKQKFIVFDTETTSLDTIKSELVGISFSFAEKEAYYIPIVAKEGQIFPIEKIIPLIKPIIENPAIKKGGQNLKFDISVLKKYGIEADGLEFDTLIASYLLTPESRKHNLDFLALEYLNYYKIKTSNLIGSGKSTISMSGVPLEQIGIYSCEDSDITFRLISILKEKLKNEGLNELFIKVEMPLVKVLAEMETTGVSLDANLLKNMSKNLETELDLLTDKIYQFTGEKFNIDSPQQLSLVLFDKLEIHKEMGIQRARKTTLGYSTDARALDKFGEHPLVKIITEYRHLRKLKSTYIDTLPNLLNEITGKIHTSFNQTITVTGRLSSSDPNLQNIPIRTKIGREIRKAFVPSNTDNFLLSADYSQIEFRVAAHFSGDEHLIEAFNQGADIHRRTAALINNISDEEVTSTQRTRAKEISFGILYGMNQYGIANRLKITPEEAEEFLRTYFAMLPGISEYINRQLINARKKGFVETLFGRRRYIANIESDNIRLRSLAEHIAINTPIQGTAADIIKIAMIDIHNRLQKKDYQTKMILQVHDELVFDVPNHELEIIKKIVRESMEGAAELKVPLKVEIGTGKNWLEAH